MCGFCFVDILILIFILLTVITFRKVPIKVEGGVKIHCLVINLAKYITISVIANKTSKYLLLNVNGTSIHLTLI